eukprot:scaffold226938_cov61-Attheya_sp.AAC.1
MVATRQRHSPLGCGCYTTAVVMIDEDVGMRPSAGAVSSTRPHPDSSFKTTTRWTGHVIINHSVVTSNQSLRDGHCCRGDKGKVDAAASAGGTGTNCGHVGPANDFGDQECHDHSCHGQGMHWTLCTGPRPTFLRPARWITLMHLRCSPWQMKTTTFKKQTPMSLDIVAFSQ